MIFLSAHCYMDRYCPWYSCRIWYWVDLRCSEWLPRWRKVFDCPRRCRSVGPVPAKGKICKWARRICCTLRARLGACWGTNCPGLGTGTRKIFYSADTRTLCRCSAFAFSGWISPVTLGWCTGEPARRTIRTNIFHFCISYQSKLTFLEIYSHLNSIFMIGTARLHFCLYVKDRHFFGGVAI